LYYLKLPGAARCSGCRTVHNDAQRNPANARIHARRRAPMATSS
jgi:hypothetical protein